MHTSLINAHLHCCILYQHRFSNNKIVRVYTLVLADYSTNEEAINHAVLKMLYRIAVQLKMSPLLYQISIFRTFMAILNEPPTSRLKVQHNTIRKFLWEIYLWVFKIIHMFNLSHKIFPYINYSNTIVYILCVKP